jgi:hypothetical protein
MTLATISQVAQFGKETVAGTGVAATVKFDTFATMPEPQGETREYRPQGTKAPTIVQLTREWVEASLAGWLSYTSDAYLLSSLLGAASISTAGVAGSKWVFTDDGATETVPQTFTMEFGNGTRAAKWTYGALTDYGFKWSRKDLTSDGKVIGQQYQDNIALSGSTTRVAATPVAPGDLNVYIDTASGSLGSTQYTSVFSTELSVAGKFGPKWPANRANTSWESLVEKPAKWGLKLLAEANTQGAANPLSWMRTGQTVFVRLMFQGGLLPGEAATNYLYQFDMACQVGKPDKLEDSDGVWAWGWDLTGICDATWGKTAMVTLQNKLAAL